MESEKSIRPTDVELKDRLVAINRVTKVTKGGRHFSFSAIVVVGDEQSIVGHGLGKAKILRGKSVILKDLVESLRSKKIIGACLDVLDIESSNFNINNSNNKYFEDLKKFQNVVLSPHVAGWSFESKEKMAKVILEKIHQKFQTYIND